MNRPAPADPPSPARQNVIGWIAAALVLLAAITLALHPIATTDFFWQLGAGESILDDGRVPRADRFSYTATGSDWIDLHWGFQIGLALLHRAAGLDGLTLARALCTAALAAQLLFAFAPGSVRLSALAVWAFRLSWAPRCAAPIPSLLWISATRSSSLQSVSAPHMESTPTRLIRWRRFTSSRVRRMYSPWGDVPSAAPLPVSS